MGRSTVAVALAVLLVGLASPASAEGDAVSSVSYVPPVDGTVVDGWRPPATRYGAGNRGIDYGTEPGQPVRAAAAGTVVFAGAIGASAHVVVLHPDGIRTSYSFLDGVAVRRGERVELGSVVGTAAASSIHFGARAGDEYLDPTALLEDGPPRVHLVPTEQREPQTESAERRGLLGQLAHAVGTTVRAGVDLTTSVGRFAAEHGWDATRGALRMVGEQWRRIDEGMRAWGHLVNRAWDHGPAVSRRLERVVEDQAGCTPESVPTPAGFDGRRIAILVGGLGSSSGHAAVLDVDTASLGYGDGDVLQLSYAGGQVPLAGRTVAGVPTRDYDREATWQDLRVPAAHLRQVLADIARAHPGVPVDVIAHSQGGIVARAALHGADLWDPTMPVVGNVVTLGTPHHGAVAATGAAAIGAHPLGEAILGAIDGASDGSIPADELAPRQLSSSSRLLVDDLGSRSVPAGTRVTSIAASGDLLVDAQMSAIDGATNAVVHLEGRRAHDELPGHAATHREVALALHGMGPTCREPAALLADLTLADTINLANGVRYVTDRMEDHLARLSHPAWPPVHSSPDSDSAPLSG